jgi:hypothetical protein
MPCASTAHKNGTVICGFLQAFWACSSVRHWELASSWHCLCWEICQHSPSQGEPKSPPTCGAPHLGPWVVQRRGIVCMRCTILALFCRGRMPPKLAASGPHPPFASSAHPLSPLSPIFDRPPRPFFPTISHISAPGEIPENAGINLPGAHQAPTCDQYTHPQLAPCTARAVGARFLAGGARCALSLDPCDMPISG